MWMAKTGVRARPAFPVSNKLTGPGSLFTSMSTLTRSLRFVSGRELFQSASAHHTPGRCTGGKILLVSSFSCSCLVVKPCRTLCDPMDCSLPVSSVRGISQARILKCVAISFYRGSSRPKDQTRISCTAGRFFTIEQPGNPGG